MNPQANPLHPDINTLLAQECNCARTLCDILIAERDALANNELDQLHDLSARKQEQVVELEQLSQQRTEWLHSQGVADDAAEIEKFFTAASEQTKLGWEKLLTQLEECQQLNRVNGSIVEQLQRKIRNALSILQGQPGETDLYDQRGKTSTGSANSILTRA